MKASGTRTESTRKGTVRADGRRHGEAHGSATMCGGNVHVWIGLAEVECNRLVSS